MEHIESGTVEFRLENSHLDIHVKKGEEQTITVSNAAGWNNLILVVNDVQQQPAEQESGEESVPAEVQIERAGRDINGNGNRQYTDLKVTGVKEGSSLDLALLVTYNNSQSTTIYGTISVDGTSAPSFRMGSVPLIILLVILIIAAVFLLIRKMEVAPGVFNVTIECGGTKISHDAISGPRGHSFTLYKLVMSVVENSPDGESILETVQQLRKELSKNEYMFYIGKDGYGNKTYFFGEQRETLDVIRMIYPDPRVSKLSISVDFHPATGV